MNDVLTSKGFGDVSVMNLEFIDIKMHRFRAILAGISINRLALLMSALWGVRKGSIGVE